MDTIITILVGLYERMLPIGIGLLLAAVISYLIAYCVIERRGMPWEKAERKAAKKAAKAEEKARRDFWAGKRV